MSRMGVGEGRRDHPQTVEIWGDHPPGGTSVEWGAAASRTRASHAFHTADQLIAWGSGEGAGIGCSAAFLSHSE